MIEQWLPSLRPALETLGAAWAVPLGVPVGWIEVESGGRLGEVTSLDERGYFQLMPDESKQLGLDHQRLSMDSSYSLAAGFRLMDSYRAYVRRTLAQLGCLHYVMLGCEYEWRLVKFAHSIGMGAAKTLLRDALDRSSMISWDMFASYCMGREQHYCDVLKHSPTKWIALVDRVFVIGAPYGTSMLICEGPAQKKPVG